jgi:hypothetical protein
MTGEATVTLTVVKLGLQLLSSFEVLSKVFWAFKDNEPLNLVELNGAMLAVVALLFVAHCNKPILEV